MQFAIFTPTAALWPVLRNFDVFIASLGTPRADASEIAGSGLYPLEPREIIPHFVAAPGIPSAACRDRSADRVALAGPYLCNQCTRRSLTCRRWLVLGQPAAPAGRAGGRYLRVRRRPDRSGDSPRAGGS